MALPKVFSRSFNKFQEYPENLIPSWTLTFSSALSAYRKRLNTVEAHLCLVQPDEIENDFVIPIRDLATASGKKVDKRNLKSPEELNRWLGVSSAPDPADATQTITVASKKDPKCRFIYIYAENARDQLKITRSSLAEILTFHQVMPVYLDFILVFGAQSDPKDLRFSGFREQIMLRDPPRASACDALGRSGRHFQLCYNLKGVTLKKEDNENIRLHEWSIRQAAIHHQFDVVSGATLWIVTKGRLDIQQRFKELTATTGRPEDRSFGTPEECLRSSLSAHLLYCHWSTEDWRWYIRWLEEIIDTEHAMAVYGPRGPGYHHLEYKPYHIQDLQLWQDKTNEAIMVLEANMEVISALCRFYKGLLENSDFPDALKKGCTEDIKNFISYLDEITDDFKMQASRAKLLGRIIGDRKELVLQQLQGQATERTERLNLNLEREAILMRIITLVTLLYLPATFVSTFFSTDIIKYQDQQGGPPGNGKFSSTAMKRWLQVTLPLTVVTILAALIAYRWAETARQRRRESTEGTNVRSSQIPQSSQNHKPTSNPALSHSARQHFIDQDRINEFVNRVWKRRDQSLPVFKDPKGTT